MKTFNYQFYYKKILLIYQLTFYHTTHFTRKSKCVILILCLFDLC